MADTSYLGWPFFDDGHRALARQAEDWWRREGASLPDPERDDGDGDAWEACRAIVRRLGDAGWLRHVVPGRAEHPGPAEHPGDSEQTGHRERAEHPGHSGQPGPEEHQGRTEQAGPSEHTEHSRHAERWQRPAASGTAGLDVRTLCLLRETFARGSALADFAFAMQGLGSGPLSLFGTEAQRREYLPRVAAGQAIAAFALSEAEAGSDVGAMRATARRDGGDYVLDGQKCWISNAGIADFYIVFCRLPEGGDRSYAAFVVDADRPGLRVGERFDVTAPHPLGTLELAGCRVPGGALVGEPGRGLRVALATLDVFRPSVGAAALGLARRALDEALAHVREREVFGQPLARHQLTQAKLADMATAVDASALLVYRAAWARDRGGVPRVTREAAMAKLFATEAAQRVVDDAVQLLGARGVLAGAPVERLYREVRALRIYEGTSEIQRLVIAGQVLAAAVPSVAAEPSPASRES
ncbi:MAG TPA: acyl-CoA dehydrogenase family protein [Thermoanaerobaculia bacterium]|jgi:alkylation response protein AidB-like acyl-CoA dehydrogenase|nr:acyl-CoA dehydrogenase family protein [Thermoanaerobaculia bacterium]